MTEQKYNSASLKERHSAVYKKFFSTCSTVVSAPGDFLWAGNYGLLAGAPGVAQNLPLRSYAGIEETHEQGVRVASCLVFDSQKKAFMPYSMSDIIRQEMCALLTRTLHDVFGADNSKGLTIHTLNEMSPGYGINASGSLSVAITCALALHFKKIDKDTLARLEKQPIKMLRELPIFNTLFRHAWKIEAIFHGGLSSGIGAFAPFIGSTGPIAYSIEGQATSHNNRITFSCDIGESFNKRFEILDEIKYSAFRLSEFKNNTSEFYFPFDFGLINSGVAGASTISNRTLTLLDTSFQETAQFFNEDAKQFFAKHQFILRPQLINNFINQKVQHISEMFFAITEFFSINVLFSLARLNNKHLTPHDFARLIKNMSNYRGLYKMIDIVPPFANKLYTLLEYQTHAFTDEYGVGIKYSNNTHGGFVIFAGVSQRIRAHLPKTMARIGKELGEHFTVDWVSWRDGLEPHGAIIEQCIGEEIYAPQIEREIVTLVRFNADKKTRIIMTSEEYLAQREKFDVVLDGVNKEIWIRGKKITSKEMKTAKQTIKIVHAILEKGNATLSRDDIPVCSYTTDRNEFQSKIASPLVKAIEKHIKRRISFNVSGAITHFTVTFDTKDVVFYYIDKEI